MLSLNLSFQIQEKSWGKKQEKKCKHWTIATRAGKQCFGHVIAMALEKQKQMGLSRLGLA